MRINVSMQFIYRRLLFACYKSEDTKRKANKQPTIRRQWRHTGGDTMPLQIEIRY